MMDNQTYLSQVKEEPMDTISAEGNSLPTTLGVHPHVLQSHIADSPINNMSSAIMPSANINPMNDISQLCLPVHRSRSNTWPLPDDYCKDEIDQGPHMAPTEPVTKKHTARKNPWGNMSYAELIAQAIQSSDNQRATLSQIYEWMVKNIPYFRDKGDTNSSAGWKNSIRHNLSLHDRFQRIQNEGTGKSSWWMLNPDAKSGKSSRRRAHTMDQHSARTDKKRGRTKKKPDVNIQAVRTQLVATPSPAGSLTEGPECYPDSPAGGPHGPYQLSPPDFRTRASSTASSGGAYSPSAATEEMHDPQRATQSPRYYSEMWNGTGFHHNGMFPEYVPEHIMRRLQLNTTNFGSMHNMQPGLTNGPAPHSSQMNGYANRPQGYGFDTSYQHYGSNPSSLVNHYPMATTPMTQPSVQPTPMTPYQNISSRTSMNNPSPVPPQAEIHFPRSFDSSSRLAQSMPSAPSHFSNQSSNNMQVTPSTSHQIVPHNGILTATTQASPPQVSSHYGQNQSIEATTTLTVAVSHRDSTSEPRPSGTQFNGNNLDLADLDAIQTGELYCDVNEVIAHELTYSDQGIIPFEFGSGSNSTYEVFHNRSHTDPYHNTPRPANTTTLPTHSNSISQYNSPMSTENNLVH